MIEKVIHYIWLGGKPKKKESLMCINSWHRMLKGYKIIEWNEDNLNLAELEKTNTFLKMCHEKKLWAFMSDYLRLYILFNHGGIYMDTDVEVIRSFDELLNNKMFIGYDVKGYICTAVIGAEKRNDGIYQLMDFYNQKIWEVDFYNNPIIFKYIQETRPNVFESCTFLDAECFSPYHPHIEPQNDIVGGEKTYAIHWYNADWGMSRKGYVFLNTKHVRNPIAKVLSKLRKNIGYYHRKKYIQ